jgi:hypothetical protein
MRRPALVAFALAAGLSAASPVAAGAAGERGTPERDAVALGPGADRYAGLGGDDVIRGRGGNDRLSGGPGDDRVVGGAGRDRLSGGPGRDVCVADARDRRPFRGCEVVRGLPQEPPQPSPQPPPGDGTQPAPQASPLPSDAFANRNWQPTPYDTCSRALHDSYAVVGPDGKLYPGWHPPAVTDPATGQTCTFGHEHGADPGGSNLHDWVAAHNSAPGFEGRAGIPFGYASEALVEFAAANPGTANRFEDHVGHKVEYRNDVTLLDASGGYLYTEGPGGEQIRVVCDYLMKVHQGSHSADATINNAHELLYAARCNDGTEVMATIMSRFGDPNEFNRSCAPDAVVGTGASSQLPPGEGTRLIPDRACLEQYVLVPPSNPGAQSDIWALYENWIAENEIRTAGGDLLASFDPWFAVRNPSRYYWPGNPVGRPLDAAWETDPTDGGVANRPPWTGVQNMDPFDYRDPRSPFDGAERDFYIGDTEVRNAEGPARWWTDPYGGGASTEPFPGAICQLLGPNDNSGDPALKRRLFGRDTDYGGRGVHAPN